jgi:hypothetical protein
VKLVWIVGVLFVDQSELDLVILGVMGMNGLKGDLTPKSVLIEIVVYRVDCGTR